MLYHISTIWSPSCTPPPPPHTFTFHDLSFHLHKDAPSHPLLLFSPSPLRSPRALMNCLPLPVNSTDNPGEAVKDHRSALQTGPQATAQEQHANNKPAHLALTLHMHVPVCVCAGKPCMYLDPDEDVPLAWVQEVVTCYLTDCRIYRPYSNHGVCMSRGMFRFSCHRHAQNTRKSFPCAQPASSHDAFPAVCHHLGMCARTILYVQTPSECACQHGCVVFVYVCNTHRGHKSCGIHQAHPEGEAERTHMILGKAWWLGNWPMDWLEQWILAHAFMSVKPSYHYFATRTAGSVRNFHWNTTKTKLMRQA